MPQSPATQAHNSPHLTDEMADIPSKAPANPSVDTTITGRAPNRVIKRPAIAAPNAMDSRPTVSTLDKSDRLHPVSALMGIRSTLVLPMNIGATLKVSPITQEARVMRGSRRLRPGGTICKLS